MPDPASQPTGLAVGLQALAHRAHGGMDGVRVESHLHELDLLGVDRGISSRAHFRFGYVVDGEFQRNSSQGSA